MFSHRKLSSKSFLSKKKRGLSTASARGDSVGRGKTVVSKNYVYFFTFSLALRTARKWAGTSPFKICRDWRWCMHTCMMVFYAMLGSTINACYHQLLLREWLDGGLPWCILCVAEWGISIVFQTLPSGTTCLGDQRLARSKWGECIACQSAQGGMYSNEISQSNCNYKSQQWMHSSKWGECIACQGAQGGMYSIENLSIKSLTTNHNNECIAAVQEQRWWTYCKLQAAVWEGWKCL